MPRIQPLTFDPANAFVAPYGITQDQFEAIGETLNACRHQLLNDAPMRWAGDANIPEARRQWGAGFYEMPEQTLDDYQSDRKASELDRILQSAKRLGELVDKVVVLGMGGSYTAAQALMEACCHPYHNQMTRGQRGGKPRVYFEGNNIDNDWACGLLEFLETDSRGDGPEGNWGIVLIAKNGETLQSVPALQIFLDALKTKVGLDRLSEFVVGVTGETGELADLVTEIGSADHFIVPAGVGGGFGVFAAVGLMPAAVLGIDVVKMLEAAAAMNAHFQTAKLGKNAVMDYVAVNYLLRTPTAGCHALSVWSKSLEASGLWYDQICNESLGKQDNAGSSGEYLNSDGRHASAAPRQETNGNEIVNNVIVNTWRQESLAISHSKGNRALENDQSHKTLPQITNAAIKETNLAYKEVGRPTTDIYLPAADEAALGQLFQMLMLATVLECRLKELNHCGQSGVVKTKK